LEQQIDSFLLVNYLLADVIDIRQLRDICLYEFDLSIFVQCLALLDDAIRSVLVASDDVDVRGYGVLYKSFRCIFADARCCSNWESVSMLARGYILKIGAYQI